MHTANSGTGFYADEMASVKRSLPSHLKYNCTIPTIRIRLFTSAPEKQVTILCLPSVDHKTATDLIDAQQFAFISFYDKCVGITLLTGRRKASKEGLCAEYTGSAVLTNPIRTCLSHTLT